MHSNTGNSLSFLPMKLLLLSSLLLFTFHVSNAAQPKRITDADLPWPPTLPDGKTVVTDKSPDFLKAPERLQEGVVIAKEAPTIDFLFYPGQDYPGKPWSNWGDGCVANGKFYSGIGDHYAIGKGENLYGNGEALAYEYDPKTKKLRALVKVSKFLNLPKDHYAPAKIHSRIDMGSDGWLYYATHRGSSRATVDANHYKGDWIFRTHPKSGKTEIVASAPIPKHCIPNSVLDPERMIFYGGTAAGADADNQEIQFFAYDIKKKKLLYRCDNGPARYMILAQSTGKLYYVPGNSDGELLCYDPATNKPPRPTGQIFGHRAATKETKDGKVYTVSKGQGTNTVNLWEFDTKTEKVRKIGDAPVGSEAYVASMDVGPNGRYLYYVPGAHGGGFKDGTPIVQFDVKTRKRKVLAFLHPYYESKYGFIPKGTYSTEISEEGDKLYITFNTSPN